jgi:predicted negative regulator of RcsB-dependent stress response
MPDNAAAALRACAAGGREVEHDLLAETLVDEALATPQGMGDPARSGLLHERRGRYLHRAGRHDDALAAYELAVALVPSRSHRGTRSSTAGA